MEVGGSCFFFFFFFFRNRMLLVDVFTLHEGRKAWHAVACSIACLETDPNRPPCVLSFS